MIELNLNATSYDETSNNYPCEIWTSKAGTESSSDKGKSFRFERTQNNLPLSHVIEFRTGQRPLRRSSSIL
jgi:hypothetical protein